MIDWTRCKTEPRQHQKEGVLWFLKDEDPSYGRVIPRAFLLADEVGGGKSKQIVDAAQLFFEARDIDAVLTLAPAPARGVWADPRPALGEIVKHSWDSVPFACREYSVLNDDLTRPIGLHSNRTDAELKSKPFLRWLITNYEFIRRENRLVPLLQWAAHRKFWLICDEAWALKDQGTEQWKATYEIRKLAHRVTLLNGTPVADTPLDLNAQMHMLDERILGFPYVNKWGKKIYSCANSRFRHYYAGLAVKPTGEQMTMWKNLPLEQRWPRLEELRAKVAPYVLRRLTRDCFDLPPVLDPILIEARMTDDHWRLYRQMRDDMVAWLGSGEASVAKQAIVKALRLAQITSGFLGGVQQVDLDGDVLDFGTQLAEGERMIDQPPAMLREIGREKLDAMMDWLGRLSPQPERVLVWSRFRAEIERTALALSMDSTIKRRVHLLYGEQSAADRSAAIAALNPDIDPGEPVGVVGSPAAGGAAVNLAGASLAINISHSFSLRVFLQARGRIDRLGQRHPIRYVDVVATGPKGQRTMDHHVLAALREKESIAQWTTATWRRKLMEE